MRQDLEGNSTFVQNQKLIGSTHAAQERKNHAPKTDILVYIMHFFAHLSINQIITARSALYKPPPCKSKDLSFMRWPAIKNCFAYVVVKSGRILNGGDTV
jgi:hypothetical protein